MVKKKNTRNVSEEYLTSLMQQAGGSRFMEAIPQDRDLEKGMNPEAFA